MRTTTSFTGGLPAYPQPKEIMLRREKKAAACSARDAAPGITRDVDLEKIFICNA